MVLPEGFGLPPIPYLAILVSWTIIIAGMLYALEPLVDQRTVAALTPWMALGGILHALSQPPIFLYGPVLDPLFKAPAVYLTTFNTMGTMWIILAVIGIRRNFEESVPMQLGLAGTGVMTVMLLLSAVTALRSGLLELVWTTGAVIGSLVISGLAILLVALWRTPIIIRARHAAPFVIFAHVFDGVSTAIGVDGLGIGERSPLPRAIIEFASVLPTSPVIGDGWLFLLVKAAIAMAVVILMDEYLAEKPSEGALVLAVITAVGLGPAMNNFTLFLFAG